MKISIFCFCLSIIIYGCDVNKEELSTTKGQTSIVIPHSITPVMLKEVNEYMWLYKDATINYSIKTAKEAIDNFILDTTRIVFVPQKLTQNQKNVLIKQNPDLKEMIIAYDAIVVVANKLNKTENVYTTELSSILSNNITNWSHIKNSKFNGKINIYLQDSSDVLEYLKMRLLKNNNVSAKYFKENSDINVIESVKKDKFGIGFVALSWIDSLKPEVKILKTGRTKLDTDTSYVVPADIYDDYYGPHPANIYRNFYPLKRSIYMYNKGYKNDVATGFGVYVSTAKGQKLILNSGLLPATQRIKLKQE